MTGRLTIEANEKPISKVILDEIIKTSGYTVDLFLQYVPEGKGYFLIFVKYNQLVRQVYTQRNSPRTFSIANLKRALDWGKEMGFRSVSIYIDYEIYTSNIGASAASLQDE